MPNAMTAGQQRQNVWLQAWQQRQKASNPNTYNASWMPKEGWRGRFNQSQPAWKTESKPPVPGAYEHTGPREPVNTPGVPYAPPAPPPPPKPWTPGFRTLAPVGVPADGWGGGAIEHEQAPAAAPALSPGIVSPVAGQPGWGQVTSPPGAPTPTVPPGWRPPWWTDGSGARSAGGQPRTNAMRDY